MHTYLITAALSLGVLARPPTKPKFVQDANYAQGTCHIKIFRDAYDNEANTAQPYWMKVDILDNNNANIGGLGWTHCETYDGHQRCQAKSHLEDLMILDPIADYVKIDVGNTHITTNTAGPASACCSKTVDGKDSGVSHLAWSCDFACSFDHHPASDGTNG